MKKFKITLLIAVCLLSLTVVIVYAAFMFNQQVASTAKVGNIEIISKNFISYAPDVDSTNSTLYPGGKADSKYLDAIKQRADEGTPFVQDSVTCYATVKEGYNEELEPTTTEGNRNYFYLNQLGFNIEFKTDIDVYIRIHFSDAWIRTKTYNGNTQDPEYIVKGQFDLDTTSSNWVYDAETNTQNYKQKISASSEPLQFSFDLDDDYFYTFGEGDTIVNGHQSVMVQVSFTVDIIQANRAYKLWGYDPSIKYAN